MIPNSRSLNIIRSTSSKALADRKAWNYITSDIPPKTETRVNSGIYTGYKFDGHRDVSDLIGGVL